MGESVMVPPLDITPATKSLVVVTPEMIRGKTVPEIVGLIKDAPSVDITAGFPVNNFEQLRHLLYALLTIHSIPSVPIVGVKSDGEKPGVKIYMKVSSSDPTIESLIGVLGNPEILFSTSLEEGALPSTAPLADGAQLEVLPFPVANRPHDASDKEAIHVRLASHPYAARAPGLNANGGPQHIANLFLKLGQAKVLFS